MSSKELTITIHLKEGEEEIRYILEAISEKKGLSVSEYGAEIIRDHLFKMLFGGKK